MKIANPIYDVVFKYLMNDNKVAKLLLSAILEKEILDLEFAPSNGGDEEGSITKDLVKIKGLTVYQLDFAATIKDENGTISKVLIEIQKAQKAADIMRFRKYLGNQYADANNSYLVEDPKVKYRKAIPLVTIYFLGFKLKDIASPVIKVKRNYIDQATKEIITVKEEFIESLTHDSFVIQIPHLKNKRRNELELILSIFDQSKISNAYNRHVLEVDEDDFPEKYNAIIRRLIRAVSEKKVRSDMDTEDRLLEQFENYEVAIETYNKQIEEVLDQIEEKKRQLKEKDNLLEEKDNLLEEKDNLLEEKDNQMAEKDNQMAEKDNLLEVKENLLEMKNKIIEELRKKLEKS